MKAEFLLTALILVLSLCAKSAWASPYPGLPTRSQNPLLQSYYIPVMPVTGKSEWSFSHALYITNTYQQDDSSNETLVIDVENTRYDFQATFTHRLWHFNINLSLIDNDNGFLDQSIENWHDFFGLPQGGRDTAINNRVNLFYQKQGTTLVDSQHGESGLADIQLAIGYQISAQDQLWLGIEVPAADDDPFLSNDAIDVAAWYAWHRDLSEQFDGFGLAGIAFPGNEGLFQNQIENQYLFAQLGFIYQYRPAWHFFIQSDIHTRIVKNSRLDALDHSLQAQFGARMPRLFEHYQLDVFFSEDMFPGHAPDITFGIRLHPASR